MGASLYALNNPVVDISWDDAMAYAELSYANDMIALLKELKKK